MRDVDGVNRSLNTPAAWQVKYSGKPLTTASNNRLSLNFHDSVLESYLISLVNNNLNLAAVAFQIKEAIYVLELNKSQKQPVLTAALGESLSKNGILLSQFREYYQRPRK